MTARTVIAFDYGSKRIGIAVGQELTKTASPLTTIRHSSNTSAKDFASNFNWSAIDEIINDWQPQALVVGLPLMADGGESDVTRAAKTFGEQLQKRYNLETYWVDERLTSAEAERMIAASPIGGKRNGSKAQNREIVDRMAAKIILESWFNQQ